MDFDEKFGLSRLAMPVKIILTITALFLFGLMMSLPTSVMHATEENHQKVAQSTPAEAPAEAALKVGVLPFYLEDVGCSFVKIDEDNYEDYPIVISGVQGSFIQLNDKLVELEDVTADEEYDKMRFTGELDGKPVSVFLITGEGEPTDGGASYPLVPLEVKWNKQSVNLVLTGSCGC